MGAMVVGLAAPAFPQGTPAPAPVAPAPAPPAKTPAKTDPMKSDAKVVKTKSATGAVKSASAESLTLVTKDKDKKEKEWAFVLDKDTKITKAGKAVGAKDLTDKDTATVAYTEADGKMMAKTVTVKAAPKTAAKKPQS